MDTKLILGSQGGPLRIKVASNAWWILVCYYCEKFKDSIYNAYTQGGVPMAVTSSTHHTILDTTPSPKVGVACIFTCNNMNYFTSSHDVSHLT